MKGSIGQLRKHDIAIVGGGSAGAVLAARLSEESSRSVVLFEAGPVYPPRNLPAVLTDPNLSGGDDRHDWGYVSEPSVVGRLIGPRRGKVLGGSSATNAAVAIRARSADFERWGPRGIIGWSFEEVLDTFKRMENTPSGDERWHGRTGPFPVRQPALGSLTPSCQAFVASAQELGLQCIDDFNDPYQHGVGAQPRNVVDEIRQNAAEVYLTDAVRTRSNLTIRGEAEVDRVLFQGSRAIGVQLTDGSTELSEETILAAGVYGSPAILMRSGIGPAELLRTLNIPVVADLPVGRRLMDHPFVYTVYAMAPDSPIRPAVGALLWTRSQEAGPSDLDLHVIATHFFDPALSPTGRAIVLAAAVTLPDSVGTFALKSRDPRQMPCIDLNFLAEARDRRRLEEGLGLARAIAQTPPLKDFMVSELSVGGGSMANIRSYHHATSTVPMGGDRDSSAVVDAFGAVRGVCGLRVVDASIFPEIPSAPTNLTVIMAAEHFAARITAGNQVS